MNDREKEKILWDNLWESKKNILVEKQLYEVHWKQCFEKMDCLSKEDNDLKEKIQAFFQNYQQMRKNQGLPFQRRDMVSDRLLFCRHYSPLYNCGELFDLLGERTIDFAPVMTVAYWADNKPSELALAHFKSVFDMLVPTYAYSFREVCDMVAEEECSMGIIPIENTSDGKLLSFYRIMEEKNLRICSTYRFDGESSAVGSTTFALIAKGLFVPVSPKEITIEISTISARSTFLPIPLILSDVLGAVLCNLSTVPVSYRDSSLCCYAAFTTNQEGLVSLLLYLWLFGNDFTIYGIY